MAVKEALAEQAINGSVTRVASTRLDMEARGLSSLVQGSVYYYYNDDELNRFGVALAALC